MKQDAFFPLAFLYLTEKKDDISDPRSFKKRCRSSTPVVGGGRETVTSATGA